MAELTQADLGTVQTLGIRLICDLRSDHERQQIPTRWPPSCPTSTLHLNISADLRAGYTAMSKALLENPSARGATDAMLASYRQFPHAFANKLDQLFDSLLNGSGLPLVFHCAAGKDRTGFVAAMLLSALGVSREQILEDYLLTARHWHGPRGEAALKRVLHPLFGGTPPDDILPPLMAVRTTWPRPSPKSPRITMNVETYLARNAGLDGQRLDALSHALLE